MKTILVVDDDTIQCHTIKAILNSAGFQVCMAFDGKEGLAEFQKNHYDLIISDVIMPEMEGIEFISKIKNINADIPIIIMSGNIVGINFLEIALKLGASAKIDKPVNKDLLISLVNKHLGL